MQPPQHTPNFWDPLCLYGMNERTNERMTVFKVTLSQLITVAGALNKSYRLQVSVVSEMVAIMFGDS